MEFARFDKIEQCPQLIGIVLNGCASEKGLASAWELVDGVESFAGFVFQFVGLVQDEVLERQFAQEGVVADEGLVVGEEDVEFGQAGQYHITFFGGLSVV